MGVLANIANEVSTLVDKKNNDYNKAFEKSYGEYGMSAYCIRVQDKINRVKALTVDNKQQEVKTESVRDTLCDIIGYSLLMIEIMDREEKTHEQKEGSGDTKQIRSSKTEC